MAHRSAWTGASRPWGAGTAAIVRLLVGADTPLSGVAIARAVGVSQPRASQVLTRLVALDAVTATRRGYVGDPSRLLGLYRSRARPHLVAPEAYWYSAAALPEQAHRIVEARANGRRALAFSADLAPDLVAPWRHPTVTVAYVDDAPDLERAGFVPAEGRADASLIVRVTDDATLFTPAPPWPHAADGIPLTDPCQSWQDLLDLGGEDRAEAAGRLRNAIVERTIRTPA
jgi:hypothetical protein